MNKETCKTCKYFVMGSGPFSVANCYVNPPTLAYASSVWTQRRPVVERTDAACIHYKERA